jgi:hypothetical protein
VTDEPLEPGPGSPIAGFDPGKLRAVAVPELAVRFAFGAAVSIVAGVAGLSLTPKFGGMFLAFPAILPATLTLLEKKHGTEDAVHDVRGAVLGSAGLVAFASLAALTFTRWAPASVLAAAAAGWVTVSLATYLTVVAFKGGLRSPRARARG